MNGFDWSIYSTEEITNLIKSFDCEFISENSLLRVIAQQIYGSSSIECMMGVIISASGELAKRIDPLVIDQNIVINYIIETNRGIHVIFADKNFAYNYINNFDFKKNWGITEISLKAYPLNVITPICETLVIRYPG